MKPPRRRTLAALGAGVAALHGAGLWSPAPGPRPAVDAVAVVVLVNVPEPVVAAAAPAPVEAVPVPKRRVAKVVAPAPVVVAVAPKSADPPPTSIAPPLQLRFRLERGDAPAGDAELDWAPDGDRYAARLVLRPDDGRTIEQTSAGVLGPAGLAPQRFVDRRTGRAMAANFQPERGVVGFSGPSLELPLPEGAQDRVSWIVQLAARVQADPAAAAAAGVVLPVFGARGDGGAWLFEPAAASDGPPDGLLHLRRAAAGPYDGAVEVWLDPAQHHLPARLVLHAPTGSARPALVLARAERP